MKLVRMTKPTKDFLHSHSWLGEFLNASMFRLGKENRRFRSQLQLILDLLFSLHLYLKLWKKNLDHHIRTNYFPASVICAQPRGR